MELAMLKQDSNSVEIESSSLFIYCLPTYQMTRISGHKPYRHGIDIPGVHLAGSRLYPKE